MQPDIHVLQAGSALRFVTAALLLVAFAAACSQRRLLAVVDKWLSTRLCRRLMMSSRYPFKQQPRVIGMLASLQKPAEPPELDVVV